MLLVLLGISTACVPNGRRPTAAPAPEAPWDSVDTHLFLIGDAGAPAVPFEPVLEALRQSAGRHPDRSVVVFLGDNIYPAGLPDSAAENRAEAERRLDAQLAAVRRSGATAILLPGNHDWDDHRAEGWSAILRQQAYIAEHASEWARMLPRGGCPGPAVEDVGRWVRLLFLDTQWWLHEHTRPSHPGSSCGADAPGEVTDSIRTALRTAGERRVIALAHHPLKSGGPHNGYLSWRDHLFPLRRVHPWLWIPLPVVGSAYSLTRRLGAIRQDLSSAPYRTLRDSLTSAFETAPPLVYAAGHEHNLQVITDPTVAYLLVSGAGIHGHHALAWPIRGTLYAARRAGFMRLDVTRDGRVRLAVLVVDKNAQAREAYARWIR